MMIALSLSKELQDFVEHAVKSGRFLDERELMREALETLKTREEFRQFQLGKLKQKLQDGVDDLDAGRAAKWNGEEIKSKGRALFAIFLALTLTATPFACGAESKAAKPGPLEAPLFARAREILKEEPLIVAGFADAGLGPPRNDGSELLWAIGNTRCFHKTIAPAGRPLSVQEKKAVGDLLARVEFRQVFAKYREINLFPPDASYQVLGIVPTDGKLGVIRAWEYSVRLDAPAADPKSARMGDGGGWDRKSIAAAWNAAMDGARVVFIK